MLYSWLTKKVIGLILYKEGHYYYYLNNKNQIRSVHLMDIMDICCPD